jgi:hypothetical protein
MKKNKYYVQFGHLQRVILESTPMKACRKVFNIYIDDGYIESLPLLFIVSERGFDFDNHEDGEDIPVYTEWVIEHLVATAN